MQEQEIVIEVKVVKTQFKRYSNDDEDFEEDDKWSRMGLAKPKDEEDKFDWVDITVLKDAVWGVYSDEGETIICMYNTDLVINMGEEEAIQKFLM